MSNTAIDPSPAAQAKALLHTTPNGGLSVLAGRGDDFDAIPCEHFAGDGYDYYLFFGGEDAEELILGMKFDDEEYLEVAEIPEDAGAL